MNLTAWRFLFVHDPETVEYGKESERGDESECIGWKLKKRTHQYTPGKKRDLHGMIHGDRPHDKLQRQDEHKQEAI